MAIIDDVSLNNNLIRLKTIGTAHNQIEDDIIGLVESMQVSYNSDNKMKLNEKNRDTKNNFQIMNQNRLGYDEVIEKAMQRYIETKEEVENKFDEIETRY